jgi:hypothetical protein
MIHNNSNRQIGVAFAAARLCAGFRFQRSCGEYSNGQIFPEAELP